MEKDQARQRAAEVVTHRRLRRPRWPDTLDVGIMAKAFAPTPDLLARFDYGHFTRPTSLEECVADLLLE